MGALDDLIKSTTPSLDALIAPKKQTNLADFRRLEDAGGAYKSDPIMSSRYTGTNPALRKAQSALDVVNRLGQKTADTLLMTDRTQMGGQYTPVATKGQETATDIGGAILGSVAPIGGIYKALDRLAGIVPAAQRLTPLARAGVKGGIAGGTYETAVGVGHGESPGEIAKRAAIGTVLGAAGDAAITKVPQLYRAMREANQMNAINRLDLTRPQALLPEPQNAGLLPEFASDPPGVIRARGVSSEPLRLPMTQGEAAIRDVMRQPQIKLLPGQVDTTVYQGGVPQRAALPMTRGEMMAREAMKPSDTKLLTGQVDTSIKPPAPAARQLLTEPAEEAALRRYADQMGYNWPLNKQQRAEGQLYKVLNDIAQPVKDRGVVPYESKRSLINFVYEGFDGTISKSEVRKLSYEQLADMAEDIVKANPPLMKLAEQEAAKRGVDINDLLKIANDPNAGPAPQPLIPRQPTQPIAELNNARNILKATKDINVAEKILRAYPQLRNEFKGWARRVDFKAKREQATMPKQAPMQTPTPAVAAEAIELNAARNILRNNRLDINRATKILETYPELRPEFKGWANRINRAQEAATKFKPTPAPKPQAPVQSPELQNARNILKNTKNLQRAQRILETYPQLQPEFKGWVGRIKRMQNQQAAAKAPMGPSPGTPQGVPMPQQGPIPPGAADRFANVFRNKVNREPKKRGTIAETMRKLQTQFVDDVAPLGRLEKSIRGGRLASAEDSLYKQARLFRGSPAKANEIVKSQLAPVVNEIERLGYNSKDLGDYALAVHDRDVNAKGINSGFSYDEIQAVISKYGTPEMESARQKLVQVGNSLLDELADAQVISRELVQTLRQKYPNYMPLFRSFDDDKVEFAQGMTKKMANVANPIKKLKGSERDVIDPLESMVKNVFQATNAADRNRVALQLAKLTDIDTEGQFIRRMAPGEEIGRKNAVYARINGEKQYFEVEPEVYKAILQLDQESSNFLIRMLQKPASVLRAGATLTPEFSFRNPIRDVLQAYVVSGSGFNPFTDFWAALFDIIRPNSKLLPQFLADNAGFGNIVSMDREVHREALRQVLKEAPGQKFINIVSGKSLIGLLRSIADVSETATKLGEYRAALRSGVSRPEAAYRARDIMDFGRAGTSIREANKVVAFMNASIQGKSKLLRAIRENPVGVTTRAVKMVTLPSVGIFLAQKYLANDEQQRMINEAPPWLRDTFWLVPVPGTNQVARVPKPFDLAPLFANLPERTLDYIANNDPKAFDKFAQETISTLSIPVMITGILPFIEGMSNYSFFRQAPIIPQREERLRQVDQADVNTTETSKMIAKATYGLTGGEGPFKNLGSPRVIDHIILGLTAGLGRYATGAVDLLLQAGGALEKPPRPTKKTSEYPLVRAFLVNENMPSNALDTIYKERDKLRRIKGSSEGRREPFQEVGKLKAIEGITAQIGDISKSMRQIENDPNMSPQEKRRRLDVLRKKRDNISRSAVKRLGI